MVGLCNINTLEHNNKPKMKYHSARKLKYNFFSISHIYTNSPAVASNLSPFKKFQWWDTVSKTATKKFQEDLSNIGGLALWV
jgi:hypothetical protein